MAQIFFTSIQGLSLDQHGILGFESVQPVVASAQPTSSGPSTVIVNSTDTLAGIFADKGDTFQCGNCSGQFSLSEFLPHKRSVCTGSRMAETQLILMEEEAEVVLTPVTSDVKLLDPNVTQDNTSDLDDGLSLVGDVFSIKVDDTANNNIIVEPYEVDEALGGPTIRVIEHINEVNLGSANNYLVPNDSLGLTTTPGLGGVEALDKFDGQIECSEESCDGGGGADIGSSGDQSGLTMCLDVDDPNRLVIMEEDENQNEGTQAWVLVPKKVLKCNFCERVFAKKHNFDQHIRSHTGERPYQCVVCGRAFTQKSAVVPHILTHKVWPKIKTLPDTSDDKARKVYACPYCPMEFFNFFTLMSHRRRVHYDEKVFKCIQKSCHLVFKDIDDFINHAESHGDKASYECRICHLQFRSLDELGQHQLFHAKQKTDKKNRNKDYRCSSCCSTFVSKESLGKHLATDHHNYPCKICSKSFVSERFLRRHLTIHSSDLKFFCMVCGRGFKTEAYLKAHSVIHSDDKPYQCKVCSTSFNRKDRLERHSRLHSDDKKFKCPFSSQDCFKEFTRKDKLKQHLLVHIKKSSWKKFTCNFCHKTFGGLSWEKHEYLCKLSKNKDTKAEGSVEPLAGD